LRPSTFFAVARTSVGLAIAVATAPLFMAGAAAQNPSIQEGAPRPLEIDGPPAPTGSAVINQAGEEGATMRAFRVTGPMSIDGVVDEAFYGSHPPITEFIQSVPVNNGEPSQRTEAWIGFDDDNVYVAAKIYDTEGPDGWIANEMRRDSPQLRSNDNFGVFLDTFYDRRNAVGFYGNAIGGLSDLQITNEGNPNFDWNPLRETRTALFDGGWSIEIAIPFKSLRYRPTREQVWGIQMRRSVLRRNEWGHIAAVPLSVAGNGSQAIFRVSMYGTLVGIEAPPPSRNLEIKPYAIAGYQRDDAATPQIPRDGYGDAGLDIKYGITESLTADLTFNTDFAQVEVDEQQVNLTRFNLTFPEKREFFLESRGIFSFGSGGQMGGFGGGGGGGGFGGGGGGGGGPQLFYSRSIGLENGVPVPILGGGRVTGKVGAFDVGLLSIQTGEGNGSSGSGLAKYERDVGSESTNFSVLRLRRDVFARSTVGVLLENRSRSIDGNGSNQAWGLDGSFGLTDEVSFLGYYMQSRSDGVTGPHHASYRGSLNYNGDVWGWGMDHTVVEHAFNPEVGFVRQADFRQTSGSGRFSPRPDIPNVRQLNFSVDADYLENARTGLVESKGYGGSASVELDNQDRMNVSWSYGYEHFVQAERISGATIPAGSYENPDWRIGFNLGPTRPIQGGISFRRGDYYGGTITSLGANQARIEVTKQFFVEPSVSFNWIDLPQGRFDQNVFVTRATYTLSPRMYVSALVQASAGNNVNFRTFIGNFRFRWEWAPGSELFIVYTEDRNADVIGEWSALNNRGLVIKVNRLLRI
jgi:hypothetical protein